MKTNNKEQKTKLLIEKIGVHSEKAGLTPAVGRIFAYLMIADPPEKSFEEIYQYLQMSKSAVSNGLNALLQHGLIDYITHMGDRKRYFHINTKGWMEQTKKQIEGQEQLQPLIKEVLKSRSNKYPEFNKALEEIIAFHDYMREEIKIAIKKWEKKYKN
ncbi:MAG: GbsR/MarR family transcriptional regulator [Bacteroidia bacterium]